MTGRAFLLACFSLFACSGPKKDQDIKETIASTAKEEVAFAGVNFVVKDGVVTLSGNAPSEKDKEKVESTVKELSGVKEVLSQIQVAPVVLGGDHPLKEAVDNVLKKYPTVQATVQDSVIVLQGTVGSKKAQKLFKALQNLKPKGLTNEMVISDQTEQEDEKDKEKKDKGK